MTMDNVSKKSMFLTLILCFAFAVIEGFDLQSMGVAAPRLKAEMGLDSKQIGLVFSAAVLGTLPGALMAGRLADKIGRKKVLIACTLMFGLTSLVLPFIREFNLLLLMRFLTGLGMGGALPMVITIVSEAVPEQYKATAVSSMYCGMPIGGITTSIIALMLSGADEWRHIFYFGGIAPLVLVPFLVLLLPESKAFLQTTASQDSANKQHLMQVLFAPERLAITVFLWLSFFGTLLVLTLLQNWLPTLITGLGLSKADGNYVQMGFNIGGALGVIMLGLMLDRMNKHTIVKCAYAGILLSLVGLAVSNTLMAFVLSAAGAGMFVIGCQSILYTLAAKYYPTHMRGTGVGAAVAVGRLGSFVGPLVAGLLLSGGKGEVFVIACSIPMILLAAISALFLLRKPTAAVETISA